MTGLYLYGLFDFAFSRLRVCDCDFFVLWVGFWMYFGGHSFDLTVCCCDLCAFCVGLFCIPMGLLVALFCLVFLYTLRTRGFVGYDLF